MRQHVDRENHIWRKLQGAEINELTYNKKIKNNARKLLTNRIKRDIISW